MDKQPTTYDLPQKTHTRKSVVSRWSLIVGQESGQSLIEILIALAIGAMIIGAATIGISFMLRSTSTNQNLQSASGFMNDLISKIRSFGGASWANIYGLTKGTGTTYFLNASSSALFAVQGSEGLFDNDVANGIVGKWGFDEATGTIAYDGSGNNNSGTLMNGPTRATSTCEAGDCISFNASSSQYVDVPATSTLNFTSNGTFSISAWVHPNTLSSAWRRGIIVQENYLTSGFRLGFANGGTPMFWTTQSGGTLELTSSEPLTVDQWNYLVVTYDNQQASLYVNGARTATSTGTYVAGSNPVRIGAAVNEYFSGLLDDIRYYNRALSAAEVKQLYSSHPFSRFFSVEDVCRTNDASSTISGVTPCAPGSLADPSTEKITATVTWPTSGNIGSIQTFDYLTRWQNDVFNQNDWSGGSGADGPYTNPGSTFSTSSNVDTNTRGEIRIHNL